MAVAVLMETELQNSLATSEEDAEYEEDEELAAQIMESTDMYASNQLKNGLAEAQNEHEGSWGDNEREVDEDVLSDEPAEGEEDEEMPDPDSNADEDDEDGEDGDEEGVGAVKIQPGIDDDEDVVSGSEEEEESAVSVEDDESKDSTDAEVEERWEPAAEEEDDLANPNRCIFCHQDEENDPSEEFELYLSCEICGDNAHRQCARNSGALKPDDDAETWYCTECITNNLLPVVSTAETEEILDPSARRISRDRIAGDLLPSQRAIKPDSHSVFAQLIAPDDPMDGSRLLRKRKNSSVEEMPSARTRNRDKASGSGQSNGQNSQENPAEASETMDIDKPAPTLVTNGNNKTSEPPASPRASRSLRPKSSVAPLPATIKERSATSLRLIFRIDPVELRHIASLPPKPKKKRSRPAPAARLSVAPSTYIPSNYSQPFYSLHDRENDELKSKPYGGILTEADADTALTLPKPEHRRQFDEARQKAEEDWKVRVADAAELAAASGMKKSRKVSGPASQIEYIEFGQYQIDIWYAAPYPEEYSRNKALFICEFCLKYMESDIVAWRHKTKCPWKHPPGDEIYRDGQVMIFEVDGRKNPLYCQNLCLLAKLFLGSKTLYYDVEPFLFYVITEYDELGCHFVGYFSKEKRPSSLNNVSCILVLPIHQRKGYGHLLMDFSYLLTRVEKKTGSPEKPLSDMGLVSYRNYWRLILCYYLQDFKSGDMIPSIKSISDDTGLTPDDVISALDALGALVRDPITGTYAFKLKADYYQEVIRQHEVKGYARLNPKGLVWTPYIMGRGNASAFDHGPPLNTVAPRDEEDENIEPKAAKNGKRDFDAFRDTNGDTEDITESLGKLTTTTGEFHTTEGDGKSPSSRKANGGHKKLSYYDEAASIPVTRFEVFPPIPGVRSHKAARPSSSRPSGRSRSSAITPSRPAPKRSSTSSSSRRSSAARPRSSTSRRKSSGTRRGPGRRWPRGSTKGDFDNSESGPGFPPKLVSRRSKLGNEVLLGDEEEDGEDGDEDEEVIEGDENSEQEQDEEAIIYEKPTTSTRRNRTRDSGRGRGLGKPILGKGKGKTPLVGDDRDQEAGDMLPIMGDLDLDAEGEDE